MEWVSNKICGKFFLKYRLRISTLKISNKNLQYKVNRRLIVPEKDRILNSTTPFLAAYQSSL